MNARTTIYRARSILTMNPNRPRATHVAVRDGIVLGAGALGELAAWGEYTLDERFADKVLMPGFVEGHSHAMEGSSWRFPYVGFHDRMDPDGRVWPGARTLDQVVERLREAEARIDDPEQALIAWGFDPIYFRDRRCNRSDLDRVSSTRRIAVMHASYHIINTNSAGLAALDWLRTGIDHPGIPLGNDGLPTGELKGPEPMAAIQAATRMGRDFMIADDDALRRFGRLAIRTGVTTATDLANPLTDATVERMLETTAASEYPLRVVPLLRPMQMTPAQSVERALALRARSTERLDLGRIKLVADGSIQGFSARLRAPGYVNGAPNGLWYTAPEVLRETIEHALAGGVLVHIHTNGDEATELVLDTMEAALARHPAFDHRFTLQHCQLADAAQFRRMKALGMSVNLFANHVFYWGEEHIAQTVGLERAERMNACATAIETGVPFAIHSDAPVTPMAPLFTAWCAVNRRTSAGRLLGRAQRIPVDAALRAITIGAAATLKLDGRVGSIATGKCADFAVLDADPLEVDPGELKDIPVWGTVQQGRVFEAARA
ncbi:MAG: amidohydrolase [Burkholderiaceae bacterium]|nr:amidohydrolase [Burkholderiaceae bacterium]